MKRTVVGSVMVAAACAGSPAVPAGPIWPDWRGPAVHCRHLGDGGLEVELVAPTAGHAFELGDVACADGRAEVRLRHAAPTADFVAQVITPHRIVVPAERLAEARVVTIWITSDRAPAAQLAIATARP